MKVAHVMLLSPLFLVSQKLKFSCSQYKVQWALLTVHPSATPCITELQKKQSTALGMDGPLLRNGYSFKMDSVEAR